MLRCDGVVPREVLAGHGSKQSLPVALEFNADAAAGREAAR